MRNTHLGQLRRGVVLFAMLPLIAQGQVTQYHAGDTITLGPDINLRVTRTSLDAFRDIKLAGKGGAFELDFDKKPGHIIALEPWTDPANSGIVLLIGLTRIPPKALAVRQPQKPEREVISVDKLDRNRLNGRGAWIGFGARPNLQVLFDIPAEIADSSASLVVEVLIDGKDPPIRLEITR